MRMLSLRGARLLAGVLALWLASAFAPCALADDLIVTRDYFEDPAGALTFADVQQQAFKPYTPPFSKGYSDSSFWFRLRIDPSRISSAQAEPRKIIVRIRPPYLREVEFFDPAHDAGRPRLSGDRVSNRQDEYRSLNLAFVIPAGDAPRDVYVRMKTSTSTFIHLEAFSAEEIIGIDYQQFALFLMFLCFLGLSVIYGGALLVIFRQAIFFWFVFRQSVAIYWSLVSFGILRFIHQGPDLNFPFLMTFAVLGFTFAAQLFDYLFFKMLRTHRVIQFAHVALLLMTLSSVPFLLTGDYRTSNQIVLTGALVFQTISAVGSWLVRPVAGDRLDRVMKWATAISYTLLTICLYVALLTHFGVLVNSSIAIYSAAYQTTISTILVAFLLYYQTLAAIAAKRRQEAELLMMTERLSLERHLREDQAALLAMLSHELRTPLAGVQMALGTVNAPSATSRRIGKTISDMSGLIEKCLNAVKLDDGRFEIRKDIFDVTALVSRAVAVAGEPERFDCEAGDALIVETDVKLLEIIVKNLIENAEKYAEPETRIFVSVARHAVDGGVDIVVANVPINGDWPDAELLFQKYYRGRAGRRRTGSGLGLYLSHKFAEWLGGELCYEPAGGQVRFRMRVPS